MSGYVRDASLRSGIFQTRRGPAASVAALVLEDGEPGYEVDTGRFVVGDGSTRWASLPSEGHGAASDIGVSGLTGLVGSNVQAVLSNVDARLPAVESDNLLKLVKTANLSDLASAGTARSNLGLGNVNNTADTAKPVSTAQQTALDGKVSLATGTATAPQPITGVFRWGPASGPGQLRVRDPADDGRSLFDLESAATSGNIFHLTTASGALQAANLIAMGVDDGSQGLYVHCRGDRPVTDQGFGLKVIVERFHSGIPLFVGAGLGAKPGIWLQQAYDTVSPSYQTGMVEFAYSALDSSQKLHEWRSPGSGLTQYTGTLGGFIRAADAALVWLSTASFQPSAVNVVPVTMLGLSGQTANLLRFYVAGGPGDVGFVAADGTFSGKAFVATAAGGYVDISDSNQAADSRRHRFDNSGGTWRLTARNDDLTNKAVLLTVSQAGALTATAGVTGTTIQATTAGAYLDFYDTGGTVDQRRWRFKQSTGSLLLCKTTDAGAPTSVLGIAQTGTLTPLDGANLVLGTATGTKIGTATSQKIGFYNATPVVQPATVADATGGAVVDTEARAAINALLSRLRAASGGIGLIA